MYEPKTYIVSKTITSSAVLTSATNFAEVIGDGILIENIILQTDATGLAGGTNFQVSSNNATGLANIIVETVANLGANATISLLDASVTKKNAVVAGGKYLRHSSTVAVCTGSGTITVFIKYTQLNDNSRLQII